MTRAFLLAFTSLALSGCTLLPAGKDTQPRRSASVPAMPVSPVAQRCLAQLGQTGSRFTPVPDQYFGAGCSNLNSVRIAGLQSDTDSVALTNLGPVACPTAQSFAQWARFGVDRAARQLLGSRLVRIETMGSYVCRNVAGSSRRSAHATAEAIDVAAFVLADGRRISVAGDWSNGSPQEREFLRIVHRSACKRFGTVLGPQYNAAHRDHFHLEKGAGARGSKGFCR